MKTWFGIQAKGESSVEVTIFDDIGAYGVSAKDFINAMSAHKGKEVTCLINSYGGSVFDALAMYNCLRANGANITTKVLGVAASAASLVAMAGDKIIMPENAFMMIHNPWAVAAGNADELRDFAATLDIIATSLVGTYVARTGLPEDEIKQLLADETWLTAEDAVAKGFATEMSEVLRIAASADMDRLPEHVKASIMEIPNCDGENDESQSDNPQDGVTITIEVEDDACDNPDCPNGGNGDCSNADCPNTACKQKKSGMSDALADQIMAYAKENNMQDFAAHIALDTTVATMDDAKARFAVAREVQSLCNVAGKGDMAAQLIRDGAGLAKARAAVTDALATSSAEHTSSVKPKGDTKAEANSGKDFWSKIFSQTAVKKE